MIPFEVFEWRIELTQVGVGLSSPQKEIGNPRLVVETIDKRIRNVYLDDIPDE